MRLRGEISGFRGQHSSGHAYFALKDDKRQDRRGDLEGQFAGLRFKPEEGMEVIATGRVTTYPNKSSYQIIIEAIEPAGIGALMALLEERKRKLAAEGLFDEARKRPLPFLPRVVGIITSPTGAGDPRHAAWLCRALPGLRAGLAGSGAGRDLRRGGDGGDRRLQRAGAGRPGAAPGCADRRARRRQPRGSLGL